MPCDQAFLNSFDVVIRLFQPSPEEGWDWRVKWKGQGHIIKTNGWNMKFNSSPWYRNIRKEIASIDMPWISKTLSSPKSTHHATVAPSPRGAHGAKLVEEEEKNLLDWHLSIEFIDDFFFFKWWIFKISRTKRAGLPLKVRAYLVKIPMLADESCRNLKGNDTLVSLHLTVTCVLHACGDAGNDRL